jgi:hypothetical protein
MAVVVWAYPAFAARFPQYASLDQNYLGSLFAEAGLYVNNTDCSVITDVTIRGLILNLMTAHLAQLNATINGQTPSTIPGRISNATQGSVSVASTLDYPPGSAQWFASTPQGAAAWAALAPYRTATYFCSPTRQFNFPFPLVPSANGAINFETP